MRELRLETRIAQAKWSAQGRVEPAEVMRGASSHSKGGQVEEFRSLFWLDEMFHGGILLPGSRGGNPQKPVSLLLTGPPGAGKSTLAMELCYRIAKRAPSDQNIEALGKRPWLLLYVSVDTSADDLIHKASGFFPDAEEVFILEDPPSKVDMTRVAVWGTNRMAEFGPLSDTVDKALGWATKVALGAEFPKFEARVLKSSSIVSRWFTGPVTKAAPQIVVVDSLNVLRPDQAGDFFQLFLQASKRTKLVIFVLDSSEQERKFWEYACDIVLRLDHSYPENYYVRSLEIVKARGQSHVLGKHQMKIYGSSMSGSSHPYCNEGIFIFPSVHYYLSLYKNSPVPTQPTQNHPSNPAAVPKSLRNLRLAIGEFPEGRCTAFVGLRGGHKSHLGYTYLLDRVINERGVGLVISLRDDAETARTTMKRVIEQEFLPGTNQELGDDLDILYYHPGYITAEEFFHRMYLGILRLRRKKRPITVLFNSLDQLSARFPLCVKQQIFVPGIIECLTGEGITSVFIGVDEPDQPVEQYGLLPMADLILRFNQQRFTNQEYLNTFLRAGGTNHPDLLTRSGDHDVIVLSVVRFAGGKKAGARGLLELVDESTDLSHVPYSERGLHFTAMLDSGTQND